MADDIRIASALTEAAAQISTPRGLPETLAAIVHAALLSVPGFDHAGISVIHQDGRIETLAATDAFVERIDAVQYETREGPCVSALRQEQVVLLPRAAEDRRWPHFTPQAVALGLRAQMALRLYQEHRSVAGLNFYSTNQESIDPEAPVVAELFATHAALALGRARQVEDLNAALETRSVIGQAMGILIERYRIDADRAFHFLTRTSQETNTKLREVAAELIRSTLADDSDDSDDSGESGREDRPAPPSAGP